MAGKNIHDINEVDHKIEKIGGPLALGAVVVLLMVIVIVVVIKSCGAARTGDENGTGSSFAGETDGINTSSQLEQTQASPDASGNDVTGENPDASGEDDNTDNGHASLHPAESVSGTDLSLHNNEFLDAEDYPEVTALIQSYFDAYAACNMTELMNIVDYNGGTPITQDELEQRAQIVEGYQDLVCYLIEGMDSNSFVVYASYNIKFYNISEPAPTLTRFYVVIGDDGAAHIYNGEVSAKLNAYLKSVNAYDCVSSLSERIDEELDEACRRDERLRELMAILYGQGDAQGTGEQE